MKIGRNDSCWCGSGKKYKQCHMGFDEKIMQYKMQGARVPSHSIIKTQKQIEGIRNASKINTKVLDKVEAYVDRKSVV